MSDAFDDLEQAEKDWWRYENLESGEPYDWGDAGRGSKPWDNIDFHLDLGCGRLSKGRLGIDRFWAPNVGMVIDLNERLPAFKAVPDEGFLALERTITAYNVRLEEKGLSGVTESEVMDPEELRGLPFPDDSIDSIVSHHALEHIGEGFLPLMDECYRILKPGGVFRIIVPLFPSKAAVEDPDHKRYFMKDSFETFCGSRDGDHWHNSFSVPYTACRFEMVDRDYTSQEEAWDEEGVWGEKGARELRVALRKWAD